MIGLRGWGVQRDNIGKILHNFEEVLLCRESESCRNQVKFNDCKNIS